MKEGLSFPQLFGGIGGGSAVRVLGRNAEPHTAPGVFMRAGVALMEKQLFIDERIVQTETWCVNLASRV